MLFIIDGPDYRGKKFLCDHLSNLLKLEVINPNIGKEVKNRDYYMNLLTTKSGVIFDTFHFYEMVWARINNRSAGICDDCCKEIEQKIIDDDVTSIFVTAKGRQLILNKNVNPSYCLSDYELILSSNSYDLLHEKYKFSTKVELNANLWR